MAADDRREWGPFGMGPWKGHEKVFCNVCKRPIAEAWKPRSEHGLHPERLVPSGRYRACRQWPLRTAGDIYRRLTTMLSLSKPS